MDTSFHQGWNVSGTMEPEMNAAIVPKYRVGRRREELLVSIKKTLLYETFFTIKHLDLTSEDERVG
jgi:hypothetical protein